MNTSIENRIKELHNEIIQNEIDYKSEEDPKKKDRFKILLTGKELSMQELELLFKKLYPNKNLPTF